MNSQGFDRISAAIEHLPLPEVVAICRAMARGHAVHAAKLTARLVPARLSGPHARRTARAKDCDRFWQALSLHFALADILAEHDLPGALAGNITRFIARQARDIADPQTLSYGALAIRQLMPPRDCLPTELPVGLIEIFGHDLDPTHPAAHAAQPEYKS